jgi:hypothetical protein
VPQSLEGRYTLGERSQNQKRPVPKPYRLSGKRPTTEYLLAKPFSSFPPPITFPSIKRDKNPFIRVQANLSAFSLGNLSLNMRMGQFYFRIPTKRHI